MYEPPILSHLARLRNVLFATFFTLKRFNLTHFGRFLGVFEVRMGRNYHCTSLYEPFAVNEVCTYTRKKMTKGFMYEPQEKRRKTNPDEKSRYAIA